MASQSTIAFMRALEQRANDPLQVLGTQKKVSFDETNNTSPTFADVGPAEIVPSSQPSTTKTEHNSIEDNAEDDLHVSKAGMVKPMNNDILSGRGAGVNLHPGNIFFRSLIQSGKAAYIAADPGEKKRIIKHIVEVAFKHGRFLKQDPKTNLWTPITIDEAKKKTGQALRENAPAIKKQRDELKQKIQLAEQLTSRPTFLPSMRKEAEMLPMVSPPLTEMTPNYASPIVSPTPTQLNASHLLWSRMNTLQDKQEQLKRKQRELEDEQNQIMQYFYQMTATMTKPTPLAPMTAMNPLDFLYTRTTATSDSSSDSETDQIYTQTHKKRRVIDTRF
mmetsp:Transcript_5250/g.7777  ORF Transcript_5250/g.7777 Transcript_5250/m.7777 type:complete len:333 (-) Transcript_5250:112-1110(-)|eukprot:CAMPEP_0203667802 /NCGR_PEP_ID=MMETSP0090-20130426/4560_1 /ASSEMBLY_ACC=CAM_ASM_001088 /TAXON_ID=426623 /ORGANISM="Chaetoceros affinis, Strain CCMP159" /LENGTH=332 /DNA_ID=CAMNT_0050532071 /DNA_START=96 /DNA_END=1094 /DNA_ORIENTATION=-